MLYISKIKQNNKKIFIKNKWINILLFNHNYWRTPTPRGATCMSANRNITIYDVLRNPCIQWDWGYMSANPNTTLNTVKELPRKEWNW